MCPLGHLARGRKRLLTTARAANRYRPDMDTLPKPWTGTALGITSWGRGGELTRNSHGPLIVSYSYTKNDQKQKKDQSTKTEIRAN